MGSGGCGSLASAWLVRTYSTVVWRVGLVRARMLAKSSLTAKPLKIKIFARLSGAWRSSQAKIFKSLIARV
jgi:hypothetical protein